MDRAALGVFTYADVARRVHLTDPAPVPGLPDGIQAITAGENHSLAVTFEGAVFAWGQGSFGELGDGGKEHRYPPVAVTGLSAGVCAVATGNSCSFAIRNDNALLSWGRLGDGTIVDRSTPGPVPALVGGVAATTDRLALMDDGSVVAWGGEYPADERGADARLDVAASKLGGRPDLRLGSRWPLRDRRPLAFVAQLNLAAIAPLDREGRPTAGGPAVVLLELCGLAGRPLHGALQLAGNGASPARVPRRTRR